MTESSTDAMIGRLIDGRYQVRSRIARGGMATVYLATDLRLERRVAIKVMHGHLADDQAFKSRFVQEARSAARLAHPNVVNVFDQGQDADMAYLVMEYLPGITLRDLLKDYGKLTPEQAVDILEAILSGLAAAHRAGIVHRDLKPENVLLADDGRIKLGDFGLARAASNNTATGQALLGTIAYLSPELITRGIADARSDIYALGIMLFEMLTGDHPYVGDAPMQIAYQHANDTVPPPSSRVPSTPHELDELVRWATARDPEDRPRDAGVMLQRLREVESGARGTGANGLAHTMVLPSGLGQPTASVDADAATQVFGLAPAALVPSDTAEQPDLPESSVLLAARSRRRRRSGYWLIALILLVTAAIGGAGWYFGSGPGSEVLVPKLASLTLDQASARLTEQGLTAKAGKAFSSTVEKGHVVDTEPGPGAHVPKGSAVTLNISQGPQPITLPKLAGLSVDAAKKAIVASHAQVGSMQTQFSDDADKNVVLAAYRASDDSEISGGGSYFIDLKINLLVSLGAVPDVTGETVDDAISILDDVKLKAQSGDEQYDAEIPAGSVISAHHLEDGAVHEGDTFVLTVSKGPEPVEVPNVVGLPWNDGKKKLTDLGFTLTYNPGADAVAPLLKVQSQDPAAGTLAPPGSTVSLTPSF
ncbi:Stk1 family PASTA domain-containing Ser/Thr kinase [Cryobacterium tepidiphilum]|uniref:non-specific serine/threonine protein kinase n=1 Tax=Cryobacterium tepidiphilum TaxID=2486026 RepID=A0A3M8L2C0_9MICO|nr:Stk1 family PASTA domain-containing Ser/Thr kinase [Cryobacterium tepidiphilum]RNE59435.1 Stk1 family PASTA domain-containing Ser/Thr kinase [Cryobacterium tepidiphilum]